jgi:hypothetical protein
MNIFRAVAVAVAMRLLLLETNTGFCPGSEVIVAEGRRRFTAGGSPPLAEKVRAT